MGNMPSLAGYGQEWVRIPHADERSLEAHRRLLRGHGLTEADGSGQYRTLVS